MHFVRFQQGGRLGVNMWSLGFMVHWRHADYHILPQSLIPTPQHSHSRLGPMVLNSLRIMSADQLPCLQHTGNAEETLV